MMRKNRTFGVVIGLLLIVSLTAGVSSVRAGDDDKVVFNTQSHKYHCLTCQYAVKCTKNCVTITREEAVKRGGVPCKVCGGSCQKSAADSIRRNSNPSD